MLEGFGLQVSQLMKRYTQEQVGLDLVVTQLPMLGNILQLQIRGRKLLTIQLGIIGGSDGFGDGTRGYLAFGTQFIQFTNTVYEYIPITNTWEQKTSCPAPFAYSHGFTLNGKYYIGPENGNNKVYAYDFQSDVWSEVAPFSRTDRRAQVAFSANGKGYIGMGMYVFGSVIGDFFSYPSSY